MSWRKRFFKLMPWILVLLAEQALARAGGGHSFSGGHSSGGGYHGGGGYGGGGGGDGLGELIFWIFQLSFDRPLVGLPLDALIIYIIILILRTRNQSSVIEASGPPRVAAYRRAGLLKLQERDANFSLPYFADFTYSLYSEVQKARGAGHLRDYSSYLSDTVIQKLQNLSPQTNEVRGIVVGGWHVAGVNIPLDGTVRVSLEFETNYSEIINGKEHRWYSDEIWTLERAADVQSKSPEEMNVRTCPNCGAALAYSATRVCKSCGEKIDSGTFSWFVRDIDAHREVRPPALTSDVPEEGGDLPTQYARDFETQYAQFQAAHPEFKLEDFMPRTMQIFTAIQQAWSERRWELARPYESERLFQSHLYWIEEYKRQGLRNDLQQIQVAHIDSVAMVQDRFVTSFTVRIFASLIDTTVDEVGHVVSGDPKRARKFTEYWTFIRGQSAPAKPITPFGVCPSCGAAMKVGMTGVCEYCGNQITTGNFDWVLSMIEQDESYQG